ncbi:unnamed protein product [Lymnaea stagnalis]|uniref:ArfGAP with GTPase domain, ankyrin repeat and PH domain 1 n=2 Tax=Panpulmonata TaxID=977775 RepID=A0AAV2HL83_LYMST
MRMNARSPMQSYWSNSLAIRQEIQRFESVHPSIYAIYDLIEAIPDPLIQQQIREHVVCIEDSFVNSQEWTLSRSVPDLKLGILGSVQSGKSALVHRYLTGSYMQEESPEGGRFKKEVIIEGQSYLLLIRDEGGTPEMQFTHWVDAVIFVFSLENEMSFQAVHSHYAKMRQYRDTKEIPLILVGTQDAISESNPRIIDDTRARKLANDLKRCSYYETCATYGLNVERVFQDACQRIVQMRYPNAPSSVPAVIPSTPNHSQRSFYISQTSSNKPSDTHSISSHSTSSSGTLVTAHSQPPLPPPKEKEVREGKTDRPEKKKDKPLPHVAQATVLVPPTTQPPQVPAIPPPQPVPITQLTELNDIQGFDNLLEETVTCTPLALRKNKKFSVKKSNSFNSLCLENIVTSFLKKEIILNFCISHYFNKLIQPKSKEEEKKQAGDGEKVGSGRTIPLKQGYLYKKSHGLNKEWKKKYVALSDDGRLVYHSSLHDYMEDTHAKEIPLVKTTVKIPGMRPRGSRTVSTGNAPNGDMNNSIVIKLSSNYLLFSFLFYTFDVSGDSQIDNSLVIPNSSITPVIPDQPRTRPERSPMLPKLGINSSSRDTPNVKKRHRRAKSGGIKNSNPGDGDDSDGYEFVIVSLENKQWHFEALSGEERDCWVDAIEQQILSSLQANDAGKNKKQNNSDPAGIQAIRCARGNNACADCSSPSPDWASINLGALVCIECSGIHRNLGTHISRVRSLDLDEWPNDIVKVMVSIGNSTVNSVWEANTKGRPKPTQCSPRDEKERWIRAKYEAKEFLPPLPYIDIPVNQQLIDALVREDIRNIIIILGHAEPEDINAPYSKDDGRTALHIAAALGNVVFVQLLLWYNANVKVVDHEGRNALWYARSSGSSECTELLTTSGCPEHPTLPRRRGSVQQGKNDVFDKLPASVI